MTNKKYIGTVDCTPTWAGILPGLLAAHEDGTPKGRGIALEELTRLAQIADRSVHAVNCHDELVAALEAARYDLVHLVRMMDDEGTYRETIDDADAALAKAKP